MAFWLVITDEEIGFLGRLLWVVGQNSIFIFDLCLVCCIFSLSEVGKGQKGEEISLLYGYLTPVVGAAFKVRSLNVRKGAQVGPPCQPVFKIPTEDLSQKSSRKTMCTTPPLKNN